MQSYVTLPYCLWRIICLVSWFFSLQRYNNIILFIISAWMLWIFCLSPFVPFIYFSFLNDLILLFGNSVIFEVNKTESPTSKLIFCRNGLVYFSVFTITRSTMLLFWNWIKFLLKSSLLLNEVFCYCNSEGNHWQLEEETILHLH